MMQVKPLDLNEVLASLLKMLRPMLGEPIELMLQGETAPLWIEADRGMVEQVVMNLCLNARDAMPQGGRLTLKTQSLEVDPAAIQSNPDAHPGKYLCLSVIDTGCGMDEATQSRLFEPFFTTKDIGKGTGLGLATAYGAVKQHAGWIEVESRLGQGSTFRVFLPVSKQVPTHPAEETGSFSARSQCGRETILLVEDDPAVREVAVQSLRRLGYCVLPAANGVEALQQWRVAATPIDLLFTDMVMPEGMSGLELAERLQGIQRQLKVIISSGYAEDMNQLEGRLSSSISFLPKPYESALLAAAVRKVLDQA
jgi:two-component system, cell cycle sensor histidine kinase and response regulator CckA